MNNAFLNTIRQRRTQYALDKTLPLPQQDVTALIQEAVRLAPSAFNSQSTRVVILFGAQSERFWDFVKDALRKVVPAETFAATEEKINGFAAGAGTVLFYEDQDVVAGLQTQFPPYADNFPVWSEHASAMAQFAVWNALACADIGASLQHYNPLPDSAAAAQWQLPAAWKLRAQMPFGAHARGFGEKTFIDDAQRFRVFG